MNACTSVVVRTLPDTMHHISNVKLQLLLKLKPTFNLKKILWLIFAASEDVHKDCYANTYPIPTGNIYRTVHATQQNASIHMLLSLFLFQSFFSSIFFLHKHTSTILYVLWDSCQRSYIHLSGLYNACIVVKSPWTRTRLKSVSLCLRSHQISHCKPFSTTI